MAWGRAYDGSNNNKDESTKYLPLTGGTLTGKLNATTGVKIGSCDMVYDSTNKCLNFNFS